MLEELMLMRVCIVCIAMASGMYIIRQVVGVYAVICKMQIVKLVLEIMKELGSAR